MSGKRIRTALALGGAALVTAVALAGSASAWASEVMLRNENIAPGQEMCIATGATRRLRRSPCGLLS